MAQLGLEKKRLFGSIISVNQLDLTKKKEQANSLDVALGNLLFVALKPFSVQNLSEIQEANRSISISFNYKRTKDLYDKQKPHFLSKDMNVAIWVDGSPYHISLCSAKFSPCPSQIKSDFFNSAFAPNKLKLGKIVASSFSIDKTLTAEAYGSFYVVKVEPKFLEYEYGDSEYRTSALHISIAKDITQYDKLPKESDTLEKEKYHVLQKSEITLRREKFIEGLQENVSSVGSAGRLVFLRSTCH